MVVLGCAPAAKRLSGAATEGAVEGAVETANQPETRDQLARVLGDPELQDSLAGMTAALTRGALAGAVESPVEIGPVSEDLGAGLVRGMSGEMPPIEDTVGGAVDAAIGSAGSPDNRARARQLVTDVTDTAIRTATRSLATGVEQDLLPMFEHVRMQVPSVGTVLDEDARHRVGALAYELSRQTTLGFQQAMAQIAEENRRNEEGVLGRMSVIGWAILASALVLLLGAIVIIVVLAVKNRRTNEQLREDSREREQLLVSLVAGLTGREGMDDEQVQAMVGRLRGDEPASETRAHS